MQPQRIHAASSSWGGPDDFSFSWGTKSHSVIRAGSRKVRVQEQENHKSCFKHRTLAVAQTTHSNVTVAHASGLSWQNTILHVTKMTTFFTAEVTDRIDGDVPTSSAESGGHLPRCQTPERRENDKITVNNMIGGDGRDTWNSVLLWYNNYIGI